MSKRHFLDNKKIAHSPRRSRPIGVSGGTSNTTNTVRSSCYPRAPRNMTKRRPIPHEPSLVFPGAVPVAATNRTSMKEKSTLTPKSEVPKSGDLSSSTASATPPEVSPGESGRYSPDFKDEANKVVDGMREAASVGRGHALTPRSTNTSTPPLTTAAAAVSNSSGGALIDLHVATPASRDTAPRFRLVASPDAALSPVSGMGADMSGAPHWLFSPEEEAQSAAKATFDRRMLTTGTAVKITSETSRPCPARDSAPSKERKGAVVVVVNPSDPPRLQTDPCASSREKERADLAALAEALKSQGSHGHGDVQNQPSPKPPRGAAAVVKSTATSELASVTPNSFGSQSRVAGGDQHGVVAMATPSAMRITLTPSSSLDSAAREQTQTIERGGAAKEGGQAESPSAEVSAGLVYESPLWRIRRLTEVSSPFLFRFGAGGGAIRSQSPEEEGTDEGLTGSESASRPTEGQGEAIPSLSPLARSNQSRRATSPRPFNLSYQSGLALRSPRRVMREAAEEAASHEAANREAMTRKTARKAAAEVAETEAVRVRERESASATHPPNTTNNLGSSARDNDRPAWNDRACFQKDDALGAVGHRDETAPPFASPRRALCSAMARLKAKEERLKSALAPQPKNDVQAPGMTTRAASKEVKQQREDVSVSTAASAAMALNGHLEAPRGRAMARFILWAATTLSLILSNAVIRAACDEWFASRAHSSKGLIAAWFALATDRVPVSWGLLGTAISSACAASAVVFVAGPEATGVPERAHVRSLRHGGKTFWAHSTTAAGTAIVWMLGAFGLVAYAAGWSASAFHYLTTAPRVRPAGLVERLLLALGLRVPPPAPPIGGFFAALGGWAARSPGETGALTNAARRLTSASPPELARELRAAAARGLADAWAAADVTADVDPHARRVGAAAAVLVVLTVGYVCAVVGRRRALAAAAVVPLASPGAAVVAALFVGGLNPPVER